MKQIHGYDARTNLLGEVVSITMCGLKGKANTRNPANVTCGRCKRSLNKRVREDRV